MAAAELILRERTTDEKGNLYEIVIWKVRPSERQPDGVRYRLALMRAGERVPAVLYDNHHPKGHHRHLRGVEEAYGFVGVERLVADFMADVRRILGADE